MLKILVIMAILITQLIPFYSPSNVSNYHNLQELNPNCIVTVAIVEQPKNLAKLQLDIENHIILNKTCMYKLFIPNNEIIKAVAYLTRFGIQTSVYMNVILATGKVCSFEKALNGKFYVINFHDIKFYEFLGDPPVSIGNALVFSTNITSQILQKPNTLYNYSQAIAYNVIYPCILREAYNVTTLYSRGIMGNGTNIGIIDFCGDPYIYQQLICFDKKFNIQNPPRFILCPIGPYNPNQGIESGWALEISLDVEYSHSIAPAAGIILYVANPNVPLPAIIAFVDQQDKVSVVSQSFGIPEIYFDLGLIPLSYLQSLTYEYWLGEVEGITFVAASGDYGGNGYNFFLSPQGGLLIPASDPYVLAVGGSTLYYSCNKTIQEAWSGESIYGASTGGFSSVFPSPWYQGVKGFREVPDVIADANPYTGVPVIYYYGEEYLIGGTSVASPIVAGIIDLATQVHGKFGFINPLIYSLKGTKALEQVTFGYNTPYYIKNSSYNPVSGLGYINAGYFISLIRNESTISVAVSNITYNDGQLVKVIVKASPLVPVTGYVYNGSNILEKFPLVYNGTYWIGYFTAKGSGIQEVVVTQGNDKAGTYILVGLQAMFLCPQVALYPSPIGIKVIAELLYANGSAAKANGVFTAFLYQYNITTCTFEIINKTNLSAENLIQGYLYMIVNNGSYIYGCFAPTTPFGGIYIIRISCVFGFSEFVEGIYLIPYIIPAAFTEPVSIADGCNFTIGIALLSLVAPNVTVKLYNADNQLVYSFSINAISYANSIFYVGEISLPHNISRGYYKIVSVANYNSTDHMVYGEGFTQVYISSCTLRVIVTTVPNGSIYENETLGIIASITYENGTNVNFGTFNAVIIPSYMKDNFDSLDLDFSVPLNYSKGEWFGKVTTPCEKSNPLGLSAEGLSGEWCIYVYGTSYNGIPISFPTTLSYSTLNIIPSIPNDQFILLPYTFIKDFNGTLMKDAYICNVVIINHNATLVNSIIKNLTIINGSVYLINSHICSYKTINGKVLNENATTKTCNNEVNNSLSNLSESLALLAGLLAIDIVIIKKFRRK
ncbi:S53 family peptidase [Acidianus ambivalens]|nr:peptidase S53 [Acidianus ambivalens]